VKKIIKASLYSILVEKYNNESKMKCSKSQDREIYVDYGP